MNLFVFLIRRKMKLFCLPIILLFVISCHKTDKEEFNYSAMETEILQLINQYRILNKLEALDMNTILFKESCLHTNYMIEENSISHDNSEERFLRISQELGISSFAENVASGQQTANEVVSDWLNSESHRKNIEGNYRLTGISAKRNQKGEYFYAQLFAN